MAAGGGKVKAITSDSDFQKELALNSESLIVVDFFATWCGPCKAIAPKYEQLSIKYSTAHFLRVDVDVCSNTAVRYNVRSMPTFMYFYKKDKLDQVIGADAVALESGIVKHLGMIGGTDGGSGAQTGSDTSSSVSVPGQTLLNSIVNVSGSECLNESDEHTFNEALSRGNGYLESDCDEQLIISLDFHQPVKLHSLQLVASQNGSGPKTVKLFINQTHTIDFDTAEANTPAQLLQLTPDDLLEDKVISLNYLKFQNVQNLTIFIKDNQEGADTTVLQYIGLYGNILDATNMKDFKRVAGDKGETH